MPFDFWTATTLKTVFDGIYSAAAILARQSDMEPQEAKPFMRGFYWALTCMAKACRVGAVYAMPEAADLAPADPQENPDQKGFLSKLAEHEKEQNNKIT